MTWVSGRSKMHECGLPMMSLETSGSVAVLEDALERALGGGLDGLVDLVLGRPRASAEVRSVIEPSAPGPARRCRSACR